MSEAPGRYDVGIVSGRFQPFDRIDRARIEYALGHAERVLVCMLGAGLARSPREPWSDSERREMIARGTAGLPADRLAVVAVADVPYDLQRWAGRLERSVVERLADAQAEAGRSDRIAILVPPAEIEAMQALFPGWSAVALPARFSDDGHGRVREALFRSISGSAPTWREQVTAEVADFIESFMAGADAAELCAEQAFVDDYRAAWDAAPYPPVFVTVDAVVSSGADVLLVRRGNRPGQGLLALPGGFLDPAEHLFDACLRELAEETALGVDRAALRAAWRSTTVFDQPERSARGRTITHAFRFVLTSQAAPPAVTAGDDAAEASWWHRDELRPGMFFEDHYAILQQLLGLE